VSDSKYYKIKEKGDFQIVLGSGRDCDYQLSDFSEDISENHAALKRSGDRLFFKDLGSVNGTFINGKKIGKSWREITLHDKVALGGIELEIGPTLLLGRDRVELEARALSFSVKNKVLCSDVSFRAEPGTLTGIMGPAGAGKTVLLNILNGYISPDRGEVLVGSFNVHKSFGLIKDIVGYVPQDDTMIPDLTVEKSLHYNLRLRYPDMAYEVRCALIRDVLTKMGFLNERLEKLLNSKIGSKEERILSGGERKRVNIAHELVSNPLILFLDEPTSGLSSVDSEQVISLLRQMATDQQVTILTTIHQPSPSIIEQFDNLLILNHGGKIAYFGPREEAAPYFEKQTQQVCGDLNPAEYVMNVLYDWNREESPEQLFSAYQKETAPRLSDPEPVDDAPINKEKKKSTNIFHQLGVLIQRNMDIKLSDKTSFGLIFLQAFVIAGLLVFTFIGFDKDYYSEDRFARTWHYFSTEKDRRHANHETVIVQKLLKQSKIKSDQNRNLKGEQSAQRKASILFLMIASSIWFGVINGSREIISEKAILRRECKTFLSIFAYLIGKLFILSTMAAIQTLILLGTVCWFLISFDLFFVFWAILMITAMAGSCLSLLVSAFVKTEQAALMAVPIIVIPQLLLGGLIRPVKFLSDNIIAAFHLSDLILQKWAFKAMLFMTSVKDKEVLTQLINLEDPEAFNYLKYYTVSMLDMIFGSRQVFLGQLFPTGYHSFVMIILHGGIPLLLTYAVLKKKHS